MWCNRDTRAFGIYNSVQMYRIIILYLIVFCNIIYFVSDGLYSI